MSDDSRRDAAARTRLSRRDASRPRRGGAVSTVPPRRFRAPRPDDEEEADADWEHAEEKDDSEDEDFAPGEKRAALAELSDGPARKRRSQKAEADAEAGEMAAALSGDEGGDQPAAAPPAAEAPVVPVMPEPVAAIPTMPVTSIPLGAPAPDPAPLG